MRVCGGGCNNWFYHTWGQNWALQTLPWQLVLSPCGSAICLVGEMDPALGKAPPSHKYRDEESHRHRRSPTTLYLAAASGPQTSSPDQVQEAWGRGRGGVPVPHGRRGAK